MSNILKRGNLLSLTGPASITPRIPSGTYNLDIDPETREFRLFERPRFQMPEKIYGGIDHFAERAITTHAKMQQGIGVLLSGPKGTGKTVTAKGIAIGSKLPIICVTIPATGMQFLNFLEELPDACCIFIDEFEKVYHKEPDRDGMLTILDGVGTSRHLFVLTCNSEKVGEYFLNRPGRIRYHRKYRQLSPEIIHEIIRDKVKDKKMREAIEQFVAELGQISPDALVSLIGECLMHNEHPHVFAEYFNLTETWTAQRFSVEAILTEYRIKSTCPKNKRGDVTAYISELRRYADNSWDDKPDDYETCAKHVESVTSEYTAEYCKAFLRTPKPEGTMGHGDLLFRIRLNEKADFKNTRTVCGNEDHIQSLERKNGIISMTLKNGMKITLTPDSETRTGQTIGQQAKFL